MLTKIK